MGRTVLEGRTNWKRKRGKQRRHWEKDIENVLGMTTTEARRLVGIMDGFHTAVRGGGGQNVQEVIVVLH